MQFIRDPNVQEFRIQNRAHAYSITVLFSIWGYVYELLFKINSFFSQGIVRFQCFLSQLCKDLI